MSNWPGGIAAPGPVALKSTCDTYCPIGLPSSSVSGLANGWWVTVAVQPALGWVSTDVNGVLDGKVISNPVVEAVSDSEGTRKVITPEPPCTASVPDTLTWAEAGSASPMAATITPAPTTPSRTGHPRPALRDIIRTFPLLVAHTISANATAIPAAITPLTAPAATECGARRPRIPADSSQIAAATNPAASNRLGTRIQDATATTIDPPPDPVEPMSMPGMDMPGIDDGEDGE